MPMDFGRWLSRQHTENVALLPVGVWDKDGKYFAHCRSCECTYEIDDPAQFSEEGNYCGGSERCLP